MIASSALAIYWAKHKAKIILRLVITALVLLVIGVIYTAGDRNGYARANDAWVTKHNRGVSALNTKIELLEKLSAKEAKGLREANSDLQKRLDAAVSKTPVIIMRNSEGEVVKFNGKEIVPYLGKEFTDAWNRLNEEGEMK